MSKNNLLILELKIKYKHVLNQVFLDPFFCWINERSKKRFYVYYLSFLLLFLSLFFATPKYLYLDSMPEVHEGWEIVRVKANDLTNDLTYLEPDSHGAKTVFRLTVPVFVKILKTNQVVTYLFQFGLGFLLIFHVYRLSDKILKNPISSTFITSGLTFLYFGRACFVDFSWYDGWAFFALIMAMNTKNIFLIFLYCTMAAWTDERALMVLPIILIFKQIEGINASELNFKNLIKVNKLSLSVITSIVFYFGVRLFLSHNFNMHTPHASVDFTVLKYNIPFIGIGLWTFLEGFWIIFLLGIVYIFKNKNYFLSMLIACQILISCLVSFLVYDVTRSGSFLVPLLFIFLFYLKDKIKIQELNVLLFTCFAVTFVFPAYYIVGNLNMYQPFYFEFLNYVLNKFN